MIGKMRFYLCTILIVVMIVLTTGCSDGKGTRQSDDNDSDREYEDIKSFDDIFQESGYLNAIEYFNVISNKMDENEKVEFAKGVSYELLARMSDYQPLVYIQKNHIEYPPVRGYVDYLYNGIYDSNNNTFNYAYFDDEDIRNAAEKIMNDNVLDLAKSYFYENEEYDDGFAITIDPEIYIKIEKCIEIAFTKDSQGYYSIGGEPVYGLDKLVIADQKATEWDEEEIYKTLFIESPEYLKNMVDAWKTTIIIPVEIVYDEDAAANVSELDYDAEYKANIEYSIDLDGDGVEEVVTFNTISSRFLGNMLSINENLVYLDEHGIDTDLTSLGFDIVDIDTEDGRKEIIIESANPPEGTIFSIFDYTPDNEEEKVRELIAIETSGNDIVFENNGSFYQLGESNLVRGAEIKIGYYMGDGGMPVYDGPEGDGIFYINPLHTVVNMDMTVFTEPNIESESFVIKNGEGFSINYENIDGWLNIILDDNEGTEYWVDPSTLDHFEITPFENVKFYS
jgi:hypothetical protein